MITFVCESLSRFEGDLVAMADRVPAVL